MHCNVIYSVESNVATRRQGSWCLLALARMSRLERGAPMEVAPAFLQGVWRDSAVAFGDTATVSELCRQTATAASGGSTLLICWLDTAKLCATERRRNSLRIHIVE